MNSVSSAARPQRIVLLKKKDATIFTVFCLSVYPRLKKFDNRWWALMTFDILEFYATFTAACFSNF